MAITHELFAQDLTVLLREHMPEDITQDMRRIFRTYDKDNNGYIERNEFEELMLDLNFRISSQRYVDRMMRKVCLAILLRDLTP